MFTHPLTLRFTPTNRVARGISCGSIDCCGNVFTYGDPQDYYEKKAEKVEKNTVA